MNNSMQRSDVPSHHFYTYLYIFELLKLRCTDVSVEAQYKIPLYNTYTLVFFMNIYNSNTPHGFMPSQDVKILRPTTSM